MLVVVRIRNSEMKITDDLLHDFIIGSFFSSQPYYTF